MKKFLSMLLMIAIIIGIFFYPLNYYIMKPGDAYDLTDYVSVKGADTKSEGTLNMMTVAMMKATPFTYVYAKFSDEQELLKDEEVRSPDESDEDYNNRQLTLMTSSQFNAEYMAYKLTNNKYEINYQGVYVMSVVKQSAADGKLNVGDKIISIDGQKIEKQSQLPKYIESKKKGDILSVQVKRKDETSTEKVVLKEIPNTKGKIGLGISFTESKTINTDPKVKINADDIGGPSAGMMFTLEIIDQLTKGDLTKGYQIAGTGEMLEDGTIGRIGGIDKKVIAASKAGMDIFFAPDDEITKEMRQYSPEMESNYEAAIKEAKKIKTDMKIIPVKTIQDALDYLDALKQK